jgi:hypothetical protein
LVAISALGALSGSVDAAQPPDVVASDSNLNTAMGAGGLANLTLGVFNTASGYSALSSNASDDNTAAGANALYFNTTGYYNTASGLQALYSNAIGNENTASGFNVLYFNTTGSRNNASGANALFSNTTGSRNNAAGGSAMYSNTTADDNNAMGYVAMYSNTTGTLNNAVGNFSLYYNTTGSNNSAVGYAALYHNTTGSNNNAQGFYALQSNTTGSSNIAIGEYAGYNLTTGGSNIDIGSRGVAGESSVIRIGRSPSATYIAGISSAKVTGSAVYVTSTGQLGVMASSERYKTAIVPMGANTAKLRELRPVTFHLKTDPRGVTQYGLIAEEVAKVYPELVIRDAAAKIEGVRYEELAPMLLNEAQQERQAAAAQRQAQDKKIAVQAAQLHNMKQELAQMQIALTLLQARGERVANR